MKDFKKFRVEFKIPKRRWVQLMTVSQFIRWAKKIQDPNVGVEIGGTTLVVDGGDEGYLQPARAYFKQVADSYAVTFLKKPLGQYQFQCGKCKCVHTQNSYAIAQIAMGHSIVLTCDCGNKVKL